LETVAEETTPVATKQPVTVARTVPAPFAPSVPDYTLPPTARLPGLPRVSRESTYPPDPVGASEVQIELRSLEIEAQQRHQRHSEVQQRKRQFEAEQEDNQRKFEAQQRQWDAQQS